MLRIVIVDLALACALILAGQTSVPSLPVKQTPPLQTGRVQGTVVNGMTGTPVKNARLTLRPVSGDANRRYSTVSGDAGGFLIEDVSPGQFRLAVERNGFASQEYGAKGVREGATLTVLAGQVLERVNVPLMPQCVVAGRVLDEDGEPIPYVAVQAMQYVYSQNGKRDLRPAGSAATNDLGEYRIYGLAAGKYYISAIRHDRGWFGSASPRSSKSEEAYVPTYYPNSLRIEAASPLELVPGAQLQNIDLTLLKTITVRVRGRVVAAETGKPVPMGMVMLMPNGAKFPDWESAKRTRLHGPEGIFEFAGVTSGSYTATAQSWNNDKPESARMNIEVGSANIENLELVTSRGTDIPGVLRIEGSRPQGDSILSVTLQPRNRMALGNGGSASPADDGSFRIEQVHPDLYTLSITGLPDEYYVKSVRIGQAEYLKGNVDLSQGIPSGTLTVIVSVAGGQVSGSVQNSRGEPVLGALVALAPEPPMPERSDLFKTATTDQTGQYAIKGITPGKYRLFAWEDIEPGRYRDPVFLKQYERQSEIVVLRENAKERRMLKLIPAELSPLTRAPNSNSQ